MTNLTTPAEPHADPAAAPPTASLTDACDRILGALNFSSGGNDGPLAVGFCELAAALTAAGAGSVPPYPRVLAALSERLDVLSRERAAFADASQARTALEGLAALPGDYRRYHRDLLPDLSEADLSAPLFLAAAADALLQVGQQADGSAGGAGVVRAAVLRLNDYVGHRPIPVLEGGARSEVHPHERHRPVPLWRPEVGSAPGPTAELLDATLGLLRQTPADMLDEAEFHPDRMRELALDLRTYDDRHPVYKRTNYLFGEWDPESHRAGGLSRLTDENDGDEDAEGGDYTRFVLRRPVLGAIQRWVERDGDGPPAERLFDGSAALAGTVLMAAAVSGRDPHAHDSAASLMTLLPRIAALRDRFYEWLIDSQTGERAERLAEVTKRTRQPFGHVRQYLNLSLSDLTARQAQGRTVATQYARLGQPDAAREEAADNPSAAGRLEAGIECALAEGFAAAKDPAGRLRDAADRWDAAAGLIRRGVDCGLLPDPWTVIGYQGQYPLFRAREDSLPDPRLETLIELVGETLRLGGEVRIESAARGVSADDPAPAAGEAGEAGAGVGFAARLERFADWWDRFATTAVDGLPAVQGAAAVESAARVASVLGEWHDAGGADAGLGFWAKRLDELDRGASLARAADLLLRTDQPAAAAGLLYYWVGETEKFGAGPEGNTVFHLLRRSLLGQLSAAGEAGVDGVAEPAAKFFERLEPNTEHLALELPDGQRAAPRKGGDALLIGEDDDPDGGDEEEGDEFAAAYEGVTFQDSTDDGVEGDLLDGPGPPADLDELLPELVRGWDVPIRYREAVAALWRDAIAAVPPPPAAGPDAPAEAGPFVDVLRHWTGELDRLRDELTAAAALIHERPVGAATGDEIENMLRDERLQIRHRLVHRLIGAAAELTLTTRLARARLDDSAETPAASALRDDEDDSDGDGDGDGASGNAEPGADEFDVTAHRLLAAVQRRDRAAARRTFAAFAAKLRRRRLLYVPPDRGGDPVVAARSRADWRLLDHLAVELPRLGLISQTHRLLAAVLHAERGSRIGGPVVTEFDRLFRRALSAATAAAVRATAPPDRLAAPNFARIPPDPRESGRRSLYESPIESRVRTFSRLLRPFRTLWIGHSRTLRLSVAENLRDPGLRRDLKDFIAKYGGELLHARNLTLGHVRMVLHTGVDQYLDALVRNPDPLKPNTLVNDLLDRRIERPQAEKLLALILQIVVEKVDRWIEYNSLTTRSDYGERFYCLLDFLRVEVDYDRDEWHRVPRAVIFRALARTGELDLADRWLRMMRRDTRQRAEMHLVRLADREEHYGVRLPGVRDKLEERLVGPLIRERLYALVKPSLKGGHGRPARAWFAELRGEVDRLRERSRPSGPEPPEWLDGLEDEVSRQLRATADPVRLPPAPLAYGDLVGQLRRLNRK
ncbi:hypothetical protein [Alienimonas californiensis]|uniref:Uncharacterized protein n=1 Tax=Alienimonas californiensis TaxID=2527989 RepID=A0A517PDC0_9PLAN|nr:hypothetical protein [Alienimonas californiensis]QDT17321.1 hypothetical protein CA12_34410 [Alienimonas californiensis]